MGKGEEVESFIFPCSEMAVSGECSKSKRSVAMWINFLLLVLILASNPTSGNTYKLTSVEHLSDGSGIRALLSHEHVRNNVKVAVSKVAASYLAITARYEADNLFHVHITDANSSRYEVPQLLIPRLTAADPVPPLANNTLDFSYTADPFGFAITRVPTGAVLFNSTPGPNSPFGPFVFEDKYLEISTVLPPSSSLYGLGESTRPAGLRLVPGRTYTLWNMDVAATNTDIDLYGSFPYYIDVEEGGSTHAVVLLNSNGMDVYYNGSFLTFKPVGGILDFYFLAGPTPKAILDQYTQLFGRPAPMPYWTFGFHQCRYGYKNVADLRNVVGNYSAANIPLETMWSDIDYMDAFKDWTLDPVNYPPAEMKDFVDSLHANGQHFVVIVDPGIHLDNNYSSYTRGLEMDIFVKNPDGTPFLGQVWPGAVHFPDFLHPKIQDYWTTDVVEFHKILAFDGLWIDMNEVSNFCNGTRCTEALPGPGVDITTCFLNCSAYSNSYWDQPTYAINAHNEHVPLYYKTMAVDAVHATGDVEYNVHNLYGFSESIVTNKALVALFNNKRPFVLSRSTFLGSGKWTAHWTGDNGATWNDLAYSIVSILNTGLFGIPMVGADICGFQYNTTEELCTRWIELGAFYPFCRNHADIHADRHELYLWPSVTQVSIVVLDMRYRLLPYLYTLMYEAHTTGNPMARPLFFEYPEDSATLGISSQYLLGKSLLVSPVLTENATSVVAYFPAGTWYNIFDFSYNPVNVSSGTNVTLDSPIDRINIHVAAGSIVPMQQAAMTTAEVRTTPFRLLVVFSAADPASASGQLFLDDGESLAMEIGPNGTFVWFQASKSAGHGSVASDVTAGAYALQQGWIVETVSIVGVLPLPASAGFAIDGRPIPSAVVVKVDIAIDLIEVSKLSIPVGQNFTLTW